MTSGPAIRINPSSAVPPFEQVRQQIAELIRWGVLAEGQRLPTVRQLAADLGLANGTVARAYQELEAAGLVVTRRAAGTRVASAAVLQPDARLEALTLRAREFVTAGRLLGAGDDELTDALAAALKATPSAVAGP
ncbi:MULTISPECIES: GntR family transcriptional regulator [Micromonospora]|uniref:GntR family transcriptional regulator n=1 Tax=Micromonospora humida TaxID=2809018 RepID=A0ABS2ISA2_9ACTN|nr:GntR family transcriptional regulator [Micromonospora humida]MBM7077217.1 GntR family transcriptional regulator [Micromonospora humida]